PLRQCSRRAEGKLRRAARPDRQRRISRIRRALLPPGGQSDRARHGKREDVVRVEEAAPGGNRGAPFGIGSLRGRTEGASRASHHVSIEGNTLRALAFLCVLRVKFFGPVKANP